MHRRVDERLLTIAAHLHRGAVGSQHEVFWRRALARKSISGRFEPQHRFRAPMGNRGGDRAAHLADVRAVPSLRFEHEVEPDGGRLPERGLHPRQHGIRVDRPFPALQSKDRHQRERQSRSHSLSIRRVSLV